MTEATQASLTTPYEEMPFRDGEVLAFLVEKLRPSIKASIRQAIGNNFSALDVCLIRLEQSIAASPNFSSKAAIEFEVSVIRTLCERIQKDLGRR
jgi:hypothetical protein